jgi:hypothetical protein
MTCRQTGTAASSRCAASAVTASTAPCASIGATTRLATAFETSVVASVIATVVRASRAAVRASPPAAMGSAPTTPVTASTTMLSECRNWHERKTRESSKCDEESQKTESAHKPVPPFEAARPSSLGPKPKGPRAPI